MTDVVFTVHAVKPDDLGAVEIVFRTEREARAFAESRSTDFRVLAASVSRFTIGVLGTRTALPWYVQGAEQPHRSTRPGRLYPTDGGRMPDAQRSR